MTGSFINPLSRRPKAGYPDASARLQAETRALLGLSEDVVISVTELACREPVPEVTSDHLAAAFARLGWEILRSR
jgi:hypothetical protein